MSRYDKEQLQEMAQRALDARRQSDPRYFMLMVRMAAHTSLPAPVIEACLDKLAAGEELA
jgi:hypothetical protein